MSKNARFVLIAAAVAATGCASFNKQCFGDGVCRVEKGGQVTWEGPPEKVAAMQARENARNKAVADNDRAWAEAPRRPSTEPIRVLVLGPVTDQEALEPLVATYKQMLEQALRGDSRIVLVPPGQQKWLVEAQSDNRHSSFGRKEVRTAVDEALTRRLRDGGSDVDVVLVFSLATKKKSGLVAGGGGMGVAEVNNVQFGASLSSVYQFAELSSVQVGNSTDSLSLAGIDKGGKKGSADLKSKRDPERDRAAIQASASWVRATVTGRIAPELPSLAAAAEIRSKNRAQMGNQLSDVLMKLGGGTK